MLKPNGAKDGPINEEMKMVTEEMFELATGEKPVNDDLERSNCAKAGEPGHTMCGWNRAANLPVYMAGPERAVVVSVLTLNPLKL